LATLLLDISLIGPGVDASHNYERTHTDALVGTTQWLVAYLLSSNEISTGG